MSTYEWWLGLNILYELAMSHLSAVLILAIAWFALMAFALYRQPPLCAHAVWCRVLVVAALSASVAGVATFFLIPVLTKSGFFAMGYWFDWVVLAGMAAAVAGGLFAFIWPCLVLFKKRV